MIRTLRSPSTPIRVARLSIGSLAAFLLVATACAATASNGVNDVRAACDAQNQWATASSSKCTECKTSARLEECECPGFKEFSGKCKTQEADVRKEPSCTEAVSDCVTACKRDCACVDSCYAKAPACREKASARDGCITALCQDVCK